MTVFLEQPGNLPMAHKYVWWAAISGATSGLDPARVRPDLAADLERAFDESADDWWSIARGLADAPGAAFAHAPAAAANVSDFGVMLAWTRLVDRWALEPRKTLVICDDPYMFRHLATRRGVIPGDPPSLSRRAMTASVTARRRGPVIATSPGFLEWNSAAFPSVTSRGITR